jgi:hypothetical protein
LLDPSEITSKRFPSALNALAEAGRILPCSLASGSNATTERRRLRQAGSSFSKKSTVPLISACICAPPIIAKNFVASQALAAQKRAEELTIKTAELAATKIVPLLLAL